MLTSFMLITALLLAEAQLPRGAAASADPSVPEVAGAAARAALEIEVDRLAAESESLSRRLDDSEEQRAAARARLEQAAATLETEEKRRRQAEKRRRQAEKDADEAASEAEKARAMVRSAVAERDAAVQRAAASEGAGAAARRALHEAIEGREEARRRAAEAERAHEAAKERAGQAELALAAALAGQEGAPEAGTVGRRRKGGRPPCWYTAVEREDETVREKALYLVDVAIHDGYILLGRRPAPAGGPDDEDGHYASEFEEIGAQRLPYGERLSNRQAQRVLEGIAVKGRSAEIRGYSCIFYAMVWDRTSRAAKQRWREAHDLVQRYLGTYVVRDPGDYPWPH